MPASGVSTAAWTGELARCEDAGELAAVVWHVGYSDDGTLSRLHQFLETAAERARQLPDASHVAQALDAQVRALDEIGGCLDDVVVDLVDAIRVPAPEPGGVRAQAAQSTSPGAEHARSSAVSEASTRPAPGGGPQHGPTRR
ncbi:hypothetical protein [Streptacidiphilus sp. MAP5-52]|uniref:hypothetical protein n=1 Tax=Streptacidiphilus sp. MAP5-52 TaxID=3156267 RepID=UPI003519BBF2